MSDNTKANEEAEALINKAVASYERKVTPARPESKEKNTIRDIQELEERVARLENQLQAAIDSLNAATIECSGSSVVLTLPDFPT